MIFYPLKDEINLLGLLEGSDKKFYLPKIDGENLLCCPFDKNTELCESCFKTKEPTTNPIGKDLIDLVIVPALAVDKNNYRLGYGGGFFDRYLSAYSSLKPIVIGVCFDQLLVPDDLFEVHDAKLDLLITERKVLRNWCSSKRI